MNILITVLGSISAIGVCAASILSLINRSKIQEVHAMVNQRLTDALLEIAKLNHEAGVQSVTAVPLADGGSVSDAAAFGLDPGSERLIAPPESPGPAVTRFRAMRARM